MSMFSVWILYYICSFTSKILWNDVCVSQKFVCIKNEQIDISWFELGMI